VMTVEKFVDADSIDPVYYDAAYHLAPDGDAGRDALRPADGGLMAHTLFEERDLNSGQELFEGMDGIKVDPEMVELATQLVQRQAGKYDASDLEDRYETRLRALIDACCARTARFPETPGAGKASALGGCEPLTGTHRGVCC
jgi:DNA end-binding protein Ku